MYSIWFLSSRSSVTVAGLLTVGMLVKFCEIKFMMTPFAPNKYTQDNMRHVDDAIIEVNALDAPQYIWKYGQKWKTSIQPMGKCTDRKYERLHWQR